jgi:hypothetical protein
MGKKSRKKTDSKPDKKPEKNKVRNDVKSDIDYFKKIYPLMPIGDPKKFYRYFSNTQEGIQKQIDYLGYCWRRSRTDIIFSDIDYTNNEMRDRCSVFVKAEWKFRLKILEYLKRYNIEKYDLSKLFIDMSKLKNHGEIYEEIEEFIDKKFKGVYSYFRYLYLELWTVYLKVYAETCDLYEDSFNRAEIDLRLMKKKLGKIKRNWTGYEYELIEELKEEYSDWKIINICKFASENWVFHGRELKPETLRKAYYNHLEK